MKNKKEKKQEEEELTGMAAVWDYLKTFLIIFCVVFAMNKLVYINAVIPSESMQNTIIKETGCWETVWHISKMIQRDMTL